MTASVIGALRVNLGLDTAMFQKGLGDAAKSVRQAGQQFAAVAASIAAVGGALGAMGLASINSAREIANLAQISATTPEVFQEWAAAAATVGIEQDKLGDILKDVNDRVGDFIQTGGGPMADFFEKIAPRVGVTADMFRDLSGPDALQLYADTLEQAGLSQADMTFYMEAMASDLTAMLPLLRNGGAELDALGQRARDLGGVISNETVVSLAAMRQSLDDAGTVARGLGDTLGAAVAPMVQRLADAFVAVMAPGGALRGIFDGLVANLDRLTHYAMTFAAFMGARYVADLVAARMATLSLSTAFVVLRGAIMRTGIGALVVIAGEVVYQLSSLIGKVGGVGAAFKWLGELAGLVWQGIVDSAKAIPVGLAATWHQIKADFFLMLADMVSAFADMIANLAGGARGAGMDAIADKLNEVHHGIAPVWDGLWGRYSEASGAAGSGFAEAGAIISDAWAPVGAKFSELAAITDDLDSSLGSLGDTITGGGAGGASGGSGTADTWWNDLVNGVMEAQMQRTADAIDRGADAMTNFLGSIMDGSKTAMQALGDLAKMMSQAYLQRAVLGFGQTGIGGSILGALGMAVGTNANGTPAWRGGLTAVHERGGEIINLPRGTQIIPHDVSNRMADAAAKNAGASTVRVIASHDPGILLQVIDGRVDAKSPAIASSAVGMVRRGSRKTSKFLGA